MLSSNLSRLGSCRLAPTRNLIKTTIHHIIRSLISSAFPSHNASVDTYTYASHWHHTGSEEEIQDPETIQEGELLHLGVHPAGGSGGDVFELPECPNHYPTTYVKGKPRSIADLTYVP